MLQSETTELRNQIRSFIHSPLTFQRKSVSILLQVTYTTSFKGSPILIVENWNHFKHILESIASQKIISEFMARCVWYYLMLERFVPLWGEYCSTVEEYFLWLKSAVNMTCPVWSTNYELSRQTWFVFTKLLQYLYYWCVSSIDFDSGTIGLTFGRKLN